MNPYAGDWKLEPDEEPERPLKNCYLCSGRGVIGLSKAKCPECEGEGEVEMTDEELAQKQFDDFDPPDNDFGEPL